MVPIQFEYETPWSVFDHNTGSYITVHVKRFVVVLGMFKHHYTNELMYKIREDTLWHDNTVSSNEMIVTETTVLELLKMQVTE